MEDMQRLMGGGHAGAWGGRTGSLVSRAMAAGPGSADSHVRPVPWTPCAAGSTSIGCAAERHVPEEVPSARREMPLNPIMSVSAETIQTGQAQVVC